LIVQIDPVTAWSRVEREIDPAHALELARLGVVRVAPIQPPNRWRIETDSKVGILVGNGWELRISPKLEIPKLLFLLAYSLQPDGWKDIVTGFEDETELLDAVASGFSWHLDRALEQGPIRGYVTVDDRRHEIRGRVRFADQIASSRGLPIPVEITYDDFTIDVVENRLVRAATEVLLRMPRIPPHARRRLVRARAILEDVDPVAPIRPARVPALTRLNGRYAAALALAVLILNASSIKSDVGDIRATSFVFDMNEVFESFLFAALKDAFRRHGGEVRRHAVDYLDVREGAIRLEPDITWWLHGRCCAVIDAKYKSLVDRKSMPNADAYQMLAYCIALNLQRGLLIYAKGEADTRTHVIRRHPYEIDVQAIDVGANPEVLLAQVDAIAAQVALSAVAGSAA
jgi:5-methylcytosine-specific restriction enzyme subunit McrC